MPIPLITIVLERRGRKHCFGALLMAAVFAYGGLWVMAVALALFAIFLVGYSTQWQLNTRTRQYRHGGNLFGLHMGSDWLRLPDVQRVVIRYFSDFAVTDSGYSDGDESSKDRRYILLLSVPESAQGLVVGQLRNQQQAVQLGCQLGRALGLPVLECDRYGELAVVQEADPADNRAYNPPHFEPAPPIET
ncbi:hypothetical protein [Hymenobacter sp. APR13]|uniref:hypothetical protein n=1 Tax=Hymenobacter sp. APR13 TaxID=1356852 RepID=UPI0004E033BC|nr:hypothetical protein [Hymenobacter sp. APR13]AII53283.1 hypothetical protein N008_15015 [Hymenobacter sp. APR13]